MNLLNIIIEYLPRIFSELKKLKSATKPAKNEKPETLAQQLENYLLQNGFKFPDSSMRLIGIRDNSKWQNFTFDDILVAYDDDLFKETVLAAWGTTTAGKPWMDENIRQKKGWKPGALHLASGYLMEKIWKVGSYKGRSALRQSGDGIYFRDLDRNYIQSPGEALAKGNRQVHFHDMGDAKIIGYQSAGCNGCRHRRTHGKFINFLTSKGQDTFSYLVLDRDNIPPSIYVQLKRLANKELKEVIRNG